MRKLIIILLLFICFKSFGQPIVNRAGQANTVQDARLAAQYNFFVPRYADTTAANVQKGIDTCGAIIFTYSTNGFQYRQCNPKKWVELISSSVSPTSDTLVWRIGGNYLEPLSSDLLATLGSRDSIGLYFQTNGTRRLYLPPNGINRNSGAANKYLMMDTTNLFMYYGDGGGSSGITQLTGDVTAGPGSGSQAATIANDAVTYAKIQNVGANEVLGRAANSSGDVSGIALSASQLMGRGSTGDLAAVTLGTNLSMSGTTLNASGGGGSGVTKAYAPLVINGAGDSISRRFNVLAYGADNTGTTDATLAIQNTINAAAAAGGGVVFFPNGTYLISGALVTSLDGINPNCQLYIPLTQASGNGISIIFEGETPPSMEHSALIDFPINTSGAILKSTIIGSGTTPSIIGSSYYASGFGNLNFTDVYFKNITIRARSKTGGGADTINAMTGINFGKLGNTPNFKNVRVDIESKIINSSQPASTTTGIIFPPINNSAVTTTDNVFVSGYYTGVNINEHFTSLNLTVAGCYRGIQMDAMNHAIQISHYLSNCNVIGMYVNGNAYFNIDEFATEHYNNSLGARWYLFSSDITQASGTVAGNVNYWVVTSSVGVDNANWTTNITSGLNANVLGQKFVKSVATFSNTTDAKGLIVNGHEIELAAASATTPGGLNTTTQSILGSKTLLNTITKFGTTNQFAIQADYAGNGELPAGAIAGSWTTGSSFLFPSVFSATAGLKAGVGYYDGSQGRSAFEVANASGFSAALIMKGGGYVGIGVSSATSELDIYGKFRVDLNGDLIEIKNLAYSWPSSHAAGVLTNNGSGTLSWASGTSQWTTNGSDIYYNTGKVGIGVTAPSDFLHIQKSGAAGTVRALVENTNSAGDGRFTAKNNGTGTFTMTSTGSAYAGVASLFNSAQLLAEGNLDKLNFITNADVASAGTAPINFLVGGYTFASQQRMQIHTTGINVYGTINFGGNVIAGTDNTYDIGASGATRPRTGYFGTSVLSPIFNAATGFQIAGAATSRKMLVGNGTNFVASTETWAVPGTTGNVLTSDGTNWTSAAPTAGTPAGNYGNIQLNRNSLFASPASDSLDFDGGVVIKGTISATSYASGAITDSILVATGGTGAIKKVNVNVIAPLDTTRIVTAPTDFYASAYSPRTTFMYEKADRISFASDSTITPITTDSTRHWYIPALTLVASGDWLGGNTATQKLVGYTTPNNSKISVYQVSAKVLVTAVAGGGTLTTTCTYTDEGNTSRTVTFYSMGSTTAGMTATGISSYPVLGEIQCYPNTEVSVTTTLTVGTGTFDATSSIVFIRNYDQ